MLCRYLMCLIDGKHLLALGERIKWCLSELNVDTSFIRAIASILQPRSSSPFALFSPLFAFRAVHCELLAFSLSLSFSLFFISFSLFGVCFANCCMRPAVRISWHLRLVHTTEFFLRRLSLTLLHSQKKKFQQKHTL